MTAPASPLCFDCPGKRGELLRSVVQGPCDVPCRLHCVPCEEGAELPRTLLAEHAFGIVRRGLIVRVRTSGTHAVTVDVAGPGAYVPLGGGLTATALSRLLLCVYPGPRVRLDEAARADARFAAALLQLMGEALGRVEQLAAVRAVPGARERVIDFERVAPGWLDESARASLKQRDRAALLGLRVETLSRHRRAR